MRIGIVIGASCDLPQAYLEQRGLVVVPGPIRLGDTLTFDTREPRLTGDWYRRELADRRLDACTEAVSVEALRDLFLDDLVLRYDRVLMLCVSGSRSGTYSQAGLAAREILEHCRDRRTADGLREPFALRILDTGSVGPGEAILAREAVRLIEQDAPPFEKLRRAVKDRTRRVVCLLVPDDLWYLRHRAVEKGERSLTPWAYRWGRWLDLKPVLEMRRGETVVVDRVRGFERAVAAVLERARREIRAGHVRGGVALSYGGELSALRELAAFQAFEAYAARREIELQLAVMSATLAVNVGPGAFAIAWLQD